MFEEFERESLHCAQDNLRFHTCKPECLHSTPQALFQITISEILLLQEMVVYLLVPFLLAANDLCHMLNSELSREEQDLGSDIPGGLLIYKLVNLLTLVKKELWLDVTLSSQCFLLILLIQHVFQSLVSYMNRLSIQIFHFCHIKVGEACKEMLINFKQFLLFIFVVARVLYDDIQ